MSNDKVSIVVPMYNAQKYILATIESVTSQTYQDFELIIVDDGSTDDSASVVRNQMNVDSRIVLIEGRRYGSAALSRNEGIKAASGRYICFIDADDLWKPDKLDKTITHLRSNDAAFVFTGYEFGDENGVGTGKIVKVPESITYKEALSRTVIFTSTVMFDMEKLSKDDIYMPNVKSEDTATWWRILKTGIKAYGLNENLVTYRRAGKSLSSNKVEAARRIWHLYRKQEHLSLLKSAVCFVGWGFRAVARRV